MGLILLTIIGLIVGLTIGYFVSKSQHEKSIDGAKNTASGIIEQAKKEAETLQKEYLLEAKEQNQNYRLEIESELKEERAELKNQENRLLQKENNLDRKDDAIEKRERSLEEKEEKIDSKRQLIDEREQKVSELIEQQKEELEKVASLTKEEAKDIIMAETEEELTHERAMLVKDSEQRAKEEADRKAKNMLSLAIQRCAADQVSELTVTVVTLPNDDMKGRIIGREGRNIRTLETLTGIDLIIDDTPEAFEVGVHSLHPDLIKTLGRMRFRTSYGQNVLNHSIEVAKLAGVLAEELGEDATLARRAGLLHDIGKALDHEVDGSHVEIGTELVSKYKEHPVVINSVASHHGDVEATSVISVLVAAADALSAARPGARSESLENYIKRLERLENIANDFPGVDTSFAIQAGREIRVMVKPEEVTDDEATLLVREVRKRIENELEYPGHIKVTVVREVRAVDYAK